VTNTSRSGLSRPFIKTFVLRSLARLQEDECGQGLVEYCLIFALVGFGASAGMTSLASGLNSAFNAMGSIIGKYIP
jgi:pilus assembly protein Flp/PilA